MLEAVIEDKGASSVSALARRAGIPVATAHRQVATLLDAGFLSADNNVKGRHHAGPRLLALIGRLDEKQAMVNIAAGPLHALATRLDAVVQLGTFENEMVTYRIKTGHGALRLFSRVGMQLEAYCSGIGKVLLAHLPDDEREAYLDGGPFVALTNRTITDPAALRSELLKVRERGHALDDEEVAPGLRCLAVPLRGPSGRVVAAISAARETGFHAESSDADILDQLCETVSLIEDQGSQAITGPAKSACRNPIRFGGKKVHKPII